MSAPIKKKFFPLKMFNTKILDIIVQAMKALNGMDSYWKGVVGEYMKE